MASTKGLEPLTVRLEGACSIQLSYVDISLPNYNSRIAPLFQLFFSLEEKTMFFFRLIQKNDLCVYAFLINGQNSIGRITTVPAVF